jgi:segregation and condensation protein B
MEALAIIAYHQPCTRGDVEEIRGATLAQTTLESLLELGLVAPRGRREVPGRPTLWGTTPKFLEQFSLKSLADLPRKEELVTGDAPPLPGLNAPIIPEEAEAPEAAAGTEAGTEAEAEAEIEAEAEAQPEAAPEPAPETAEEASQR